MGNVGASHLGRLRTGPEDRPGDDLDQRHARPVVVDDRMVGAVDASRRPDMGQLARVLLHVGSLDVDPEGLTVDLHLDPAVEGDRLVILRGLEILGHIRVEVVLPGEPAPWCDPAAECQADADGRLHRFGVDHGKGSRQAEAHGTSLGVRLRSETGGTATEHF